MKSHSSLAMALALASASLAGFAPSQSQAQEIQEAVPLGIQAMKEAQWEKAEGIFSQIVKNYGAKGKERFGGRFGVIYYNKGFSELKIAAKLKQLGGDDNAVKAEEYYARAKESFTNCYGFPTDEKGPNSYHKRSLNLRGQSHQALGEYEDAIKMYKKFLAEREDRDRFNPGVFNINMAICHFKLEKPALKEGINYFEIALKNKVAWKTSDAAIVNAFQALTKGVIAADNEQALVDFLNQNRSAVTLKPYQMVQFGPFFQKLATEALAADMIEATYNLFALIPGTKVALSDLLTLKEKLALYPRDGLRDGDDIIVKAKLDKWYSDLRTKDRSGDPSEVISLSVMAITHETNGNARGAYAAYKQLETYFNKSNRREESLYNLVRTSSVIGEIFETERYGSLFLKDFPTSKHCEAVRKMMLSSLFANGEYEKVELLAGAMINDLPKPSKQHDICLHVLGGSKFYLGKFVAAQPYLVEHLKMYEESDSRLAASYFAASNLSRLQLWSQAAIALDGFLKKYPDAAENAFLAFALYDRANVHFSENEYDEALVLLKRVEAEFPGSNIEDAGFNLQGNILQSNEKPEEAKAYYLKALASAEGNGNGSVAAESLYYLVALLGKEKIGNDPNPNMKDAIQYYDKFWKEHPGSPFKAQVAVAGLPALAEAGRFDEALSNLQGVIAEMAKRENPAGLEGAIGSYTQNYLDAKTKAGMSLSDAADKLKDHYYSFPGIDSKDIRTLAMLRIAVIGVYEESLKAAGEEGNEALVSRNQARINSAFKELKAAYPVEKLTNFVLVRVGDYLRTRSSAPRQALPYYEERLKRPQPNGRLAAEFGIADIYGVAGSAAEMGKAIKMMEALVNEDKNSKKTRDQAQSRIVQIFAKQENWSKVVEQGLVYLQSYSKDRTKVQQAIAMAYDKQQDYLKAINVYMSLYSSNMSNWDVSVPAIDRATELMWDHGVTAKDGRSKQQLAYDTAVGYVNASRAAFDKNKTEMTELVRDSWQRVDKRVQKWEGSGTVQTLQQKQQSK